MPFMVNVIAISTNDGFWHTKIRLRSVLFVASGQIKYSSNTAHCLHVPYDTVFIRFITNPKRTQ